METGPRVVNTADNVLLIVSLAKLPAFFET